MQSRFENADTFDALTFGARMRHERERRKISIASIADSTKILGALLDGLEHDDLSRWPTGLYRRAFIRAYASSIGLDPEATVREFLECFPDPETTPVGPTAPHAAPGRPARSNNQPAVGMDMRMSLDGLRVGARFGNWFSAGNLVHGFRLRALAIAVDWFVLAVMGLASYVVVGSFWAPLCAAAALYYSAGILMLGNAPGVCLFADHGAALRKRGHAYLGFLRSRSADGEQGEDEGHGAHGEELSISSAR